MHRGEIGVIAQSITPELAAGRDLKQDTGVILGDVTPDGPADKAELQAGDIVYSLNGRRLNNARDFETALYRIPLNQTVAVEALRGTRKISAKVKVEERDDDPFRFVDLVKPDENRVPKLGIIGVPITKDIAKMLKTADPLVLQIERDGNLMYLTLSEE